MTRKPTPQVPPAVKVINCRHPDELRKQILMGPPEVEWCGACGSMRTWTIDEPPKPVLDDDRDGNGWFPPLRAVDPIHRVSAAVGRYVEEAGYAFGKPPLKPPGKPPASSQRGPIPHLPARWDGEVRVSIPAQELADLAERHRAKAAEYEAGGNAAGAAQLRAVQNWLWALLRGDDPGTILP